MVTEMVMASIGESALWCPYLFGRDLDHEWLFGSLPVMRVEVLVDKNFCLGVA